MAYIDPKTGQQVTLSGTLGEQNIAANQAGYNYVADSSAVVPTTSLGNTMNTASLPPKPDLTSQFNSATTGAIAGASTPGATWTTPTGAVVDVATGNVITPAPNQPSEPTTPKTSTLDERIKSMLGFTATAPTSSVEQYKALQQDQGIQQKQQDVADLQAQLNSITAQSQANQLSTIGQGRGIPQAIIGGQQAQIAREAAIKALPVTAALNAAQGRLQSAQDNINTLMTLTKNDAEAKYKYESDRIDYALKFADAEQTAALENAKAENERRKTLFDTFNEQKKSYVGFAVAQGDFQSAGKIAAATNDDELNKLVGGIMSKAVSALAKPAEAPTVKTINGVDMQWNPNTQKWDPIGSATQGAPGAPNKTQTAIDQLAFLRDTAKNATAIAGASGPSAISRFLGDTFVGDTEFRRLEALTNTLKTNMLTLATDPSIKKFFGPQMSNADVLLMTSAGTTINPLANSPSEMRSEIKRLDDLFNRMQTAILSGNQGNSNAITAPDGTQVILTD